MGRSVFQKVFGSSKPVIGCEKDLSTCFLTAYVEVRALKWTFRGHILAFIVLLEIIVEICDQNLSAVEALISKARSGTPKDLAAWRRIPEVLHRTLGGQNSDLGAADETRVPSVEKLQTWCYRSHQLLQEYEWLNWYATPVE